MSSDLPDSPLQRLALGVVNYASEHFVLADDLDHLDKVQRAGAPEAVILYCVRIMEALAADALKAVKLPAKATVFANLDLLQQYNLIPTTTRYWAHALRRTGNQVRHINRRVTPDDGDWSVLFVERWLEWFFLQFKSLPSLTKDQRPLELNACDAQRTLVASLDAVDFNPKNLLEPACAAAKSQLLWTPPLPSVLVEMLLDRGDHDTAQATLDVALIAFPDDLRLRQLRGLSWSRTGELQRAIEWLEPLYAEYSEDEETAGIMAGIYKRRWLEDKKSPDWLAKSHHAYRQGWKCSKKVNVYLGINAATTALWLDRPEQARQLAAEVEKILRDRVDALSHHQQEHNLIFNYWDQVTLAEAELLQSKFTAAARNYRDAFARHHKQCANIQLSREQLKQILQALGQAGDLGEVSAIAGGSVP